MGRWWQAALLEEVELVVVVSSNTSVACNYLSIYIFYIIYLSFNLFICSVLCMYIYNMPLSFQSLFSKILIHLPHWKWNLFATDPQVRLLIVCLVHRRVGLSQFLIKCLRYTSMLLSEHLLIGMSFFLFIYVNVFVLANWILSSNRYSLSYLLFYFWYGWREQVLRSE